MEYLNLFVRSIFIENMIFAYFLGMCSYLAVSKTVNTAVGLGAAVIFVLTVTVPINFLLDQYLLSPGALSWLNPEYVQIATIIFIPECNLDIFSVKIVDTSGFCG